MKSVEFEDHERRHGGLVLGLDEAGRGCLAGPVAVGYCLFPAQFFQSQSVPAELAWVRDSKLLSRARRESLVAPVREHSLCSGVVMASSRRIDDQGINPAIEHSMMAGIRRVLAAGIRPALILVDGHYPLQQLKAAFPDIPVECMIKGDNRVFSIAAASILAKVYRDRRMQRFDGLFPGYGFEKHAGYGTLFHRQRIKEQGLCPIHRRSFKMQT